MEPERPPLVTIAVPNWNSGQLLRLCLASLIRFTEVPHRIRVIDGGSDDASGATARRAADLGLIELEVRAGGNEGAKSHGAALDAGLARARTPYLFTLDSDAWARRPGWLASFVAALERNDASHAGARKFPGSAWQRLGAWLSARQPGPEARYIRPCHALYRVDVLRRHQLSFAPWTDGERWRTTGERLHEQLVELGYRPAFMPHTQVEAAVGHVRHASVVQNPEQFPSLRARAGIKGRRRIERLMEGSEAQRILHETPVP